MYEPGTPAVLKLLPIETRRTGTAIAEYRNFPEEWQIVPLDTGSPEAMAGALAHIVEIKHIPREDAQALGLHVAEDETRSACAPPTTAWSRFRARATRSATRRTRCSNTAW